jgi:hypothetical protein
MRNMAVLTWKSRRRELALSDNEDVSPNKVNSFRPRYANYRSANLPEMVKPATDTLIIDWVCRDGRGGWRERTSIE